VTGWAHGYSSVCLLIARDNSISVNISNKKDLTPDIHRYFSVIWVVYMKF